MLSLLYPVFQMLQTSDELIVDILLDMNPKKNSIGVGDRGGPCSPATLADPPVGNPLFYGNLLNFLQNGGGGGSTIF